MQLVTAFLIHENSAVVAAKIRLCLEAAGSYTGDESCVLLFAGRKQAHFERPSRNRTTFTPASNFVQPASLVMAARPQ